MLNERITKSDIEREIQGKGEFIQIDYLSRFLKSAKNTDIKRFIFLKMAEIYEKINMLKESGKCYGNAAMISITFSDKIKYFVKEAELYIKSGDFELADQATRRALREANSSQRIEVYERVKDFYKKQAEDYDKNLKRVHAAKYYERLLQMKLSDSEKKGINLRLLDLYDKLNRKTEYSSLKRRLDLSD